MYKILIVEDEPVIAHTLQSHLSKWDYEVSLVVDFKEVIEQVQSYVPPLLLMDITLPFRNGYHWCSEIRRFSKVPIILLSSASDNMNIVMAMNMGRDDFIAKPFDVNVLTAKIGALLRRTYAFGGSQNVLQHQQVFLHLSEGTLCYQEAKIELTKNELRILQLLFENIGHVVSREDMMLKLWDSDSFIDDNTLTVNVTRLRKKLEDIGLSGFIQTKKGLGYRLI